MFFLPLLLSAFLLLPFFSPCTAATLPPEATELDTGYTTVIDENQHVILESGLKIHAGDQYINEDDQFFEIISIEGSLAKARYIKPDLVSSLPSEITVQKTTAQSQPLIAIYHTHTDESYIPTDGKATTPGRGSIMQVGDVFSSRLNELGYQTLHDKTLHEPHDANAYHRSRRTFMKLLKQQPAALFDLHRDSGPLESYRTTINGQDAAKILLVVGKQNQNQATTLQYARTLKANADALYKGLVRGIFIGRGNYNQDLVPRSMLVEMGTQYNERRAAEYSAALFADILPSIIPPSPASPPSPAPDTANGILESNTVNPSASQQERSILTGNSLWIIGAVLISILAYLYLSTGSWQEAKNKLYKLYHYEFTNFLGPWKKKKK